MLKRAAAVLLSLILMLSLLCGCGGSGLSRFTDTYYDAFDTEISVIAYCKSKAEFSELSALIHSEFLRYHKIFDIYHSYDGLANARDVNLGAGSAVRAESELLDLVEFSKAMYEKTGGSMNVAMGAVLSLWHEAREYSLDNPGKEYIPSAEDLKAASAHCSIDDVVTDRNAGTITLLDPEMSLDLGAVGKGYATERVARLLEEQGFSSIAISAGGNVRTVGLKEGDKNWTIGVEAPSDEWEGPFVNVLSIGQTSVVTSGVYQRFFPVDGKNYHHIIDGQTLMPSECYLSITVVFPDSGEADALSTALFNMSLEEGREYVNSREGLEAQWILEDGSVICTQGFDALMQK